MLITFEVSCVELEDSEQKCKTCLVSSHLSDQSMIFINIPESKPLHTGRIIFCVTRDGNAETDCFFFFFCTGCALIYMQLIKCSVEVTEDFTFGFS